MKTPGSVVLTRGDVIALFQILFVQSACQHGCKLFIVRAHVTMLPSPGAGDCQESGQARGQTNKTSTTENDLTLQFHAQVKFHHNHYLKVNR